MASRWLLLLLLLLIPYLDFEPERQAVLHGREVADEGRVVQHSLQVLRRAQQLVVEHVIALARDGSQEGCSD